MHVVRRIGASPAIYQAPTSVARFDKPRSDYAGYTPGDVQVRQPSPPPQTVVPTQPKTSTTPTASPNEACAAMWTALLTQSPGYIQSCLADSRHRDAYNKICLLLAGNQLSPAAAAAQWADYVARNCPPPTSPPNRPPPPPTSTPDGGPIDPPPIEQGGPIDVPGGDSGGSPDQPAEPAGYLRQVGSIVGIGLILAVGLTYARKKGMLKLTKRRRRR